MGRGRYEDSRGLSCVRVNASEECSEGQGEVSEGRYEYGWRDAVHEKSLLIYRQADCKRAASGEDHMERISPVS